MIVHMIRRTTVTIARARVCTSTVLLPLALFLLPLLSLPAAAQEAAPAAAERGLSVELSGVEGAAAENIRNSLGSNWLAMERLNATGARRRLRARAEKQAVEALRPFGYYQAGATATLEKAGDGGWRLLLDVVPGPAVHVSELELRIDGPAQGLGPLQDWRAAWPLTPGAILDQSSWQREKQRGLELAAEFGYLDAAYNVHEIAIDLEANMASLRLVMESGPRATFGEVTFQQDFIDNAVLQALPRFEQGEHYSYWLIDQLRNDLWKLGYFDTIEVTERRNPTSDALVVDLLVALTPTHRTTHQGTIGYGTDTDFRMQYRLQRHQLSERGDNLTAGFAWQTRNEEVLLYGEYRLPRKTDSQQYWLLNPIFRDRDQTFELDVEGSDETIPVSSGRIRDLYLRAGRVKLRHRERTPEPVLETLFIDYLLGRSTIREILVASVDGGRADGLAFREETRQHLSIGVEWDLPNFSGQGFNITGHRERAWLFTANEAWGSAVDFTQAYFSSRWVFAPGPDWRLLLRGEVGYSDVSVQEFDLSIAEEQVRVSLTDLPFRYRFQAGGSQSVRGYDFEALSNNGIGSNHLLVGSLELERRVWQNWSAAAFFDIGNAFNEWEQRKLRKGVGVGVRWYTVGFPVRLDVAQALDLPGNPWRIHLTIGSTLF